LFACCELAGWLVAGVGLPRFWWPVWAYLGSSGRWPGRLCVGPTVGPDVPCAASAMRRSHSHDPVGSQRALAGARFASPVAKADAVAAAPTSSAGVGVLAGYCGPRLAGASLCICVASWCHYGSGARGWLELLATQWWCFGRRRGPPGGGVAEVAGISFFHVHESTEGVVQLGESPHRLMVGMMSALLGHRSPC
jgi:hypothetical protein